MSNYPERPTKKSRPKSTHSGSRKGRTWLQAPGSTDRAAPREEAHIDLRLCKSFLPNPTLISFLKKAPGRGTIPVGRRLKAGPRPYTV